MFQPLGLMLDLSLLLITGFDLKVGHGKDLLSALQRAKNCGLKLSLHLSEVRTHHLKICVLEKCWSWMCWHSDCGRYRPSWRRQTCCWISLRTGSVTALSCIPKWADLKTLLTKWWRTTYRWVRLRLNGAQSWLFVLNWILFFFSCRTLSDIQRQRTNRAVLLQTSFQLLVPVGTSKCDLCKFHNSYLGALLHLNIVCRWWRNTILLGESNISCILCHMTDGW